MIPVHSLLYPVVWHERNENLWVCECLVSNASMNGLKVN